MIDQVSRDRLAVILEQLMSGSITNFEFEKKVPESDDPIVWAIASSVWCLYDDFTEHALSLCDALPQETVKRWVAFLYSGEEYRWPEINYPGVRPLSHGLMSKLLGRERREKEFMAFGDYDVWPFLDFDSFNRSMKS